MTYVMSDIHGYYEKYKEMLKKINFSNEDELFVLGDVIDRGDGGIKILYDMASRSNVFPIMGNHELDAIESIKIIFDPNLDGSFSGSLKTELKDLKEEELSVVITWIALNGGDVTASEFAKLEPEERRHIYEYLLEFSLYEIIPIKDKIYVLCHAGVPEGASVKTLLNENFYKPDDFVFQRTDYNKKYFDKNIFLVTGHTPTKMINPDYASKIYKNNNNIAIDCGAGSGLALGCLCLDTENEFYV